MAAFGEGPALFRVEVILWPDAEDTERVDALLDQVLARLTAQQEGTPDALDELDLPNLGEAYSFDSPAPTGEIGFSCWARGEGVGAATQAAYDAVFRAYEEVSGRPARLWDVRVVPRTAMIDPDDDLADPHSHPHVTMLSRGPWSGPLGKLRQRAARNRSR